jgi:hypothetical protein
MTTASSFLFPQERRLAQSSSKRVQMMRRDFRCEVRESNVKNVSLVRHLIRDLRYRWETKRISQGRSLTDLDG